MQTKLKDTLLKLVVSPYLAPGLLDPGDQCLSPLPHDCAATKMCTPLTSHCQQSVTQLAEQQHMQRDTQNMRLPLTCMQPAQTMHDQ